MGKEEQVAGDFGAAALFDNSIFHAPLPIKPNSWFDSLANAEQLARQRPRGDATQTSKTSRGEEKPCNVFAILSVFTFIQLLEGKNGLTPLVGKRRWSFHHTQRRALFVVTRLWSVRVRSVYYKRPFLTLQFSSVKMELCVPPYLAKEYGRKLSSPSLRSILLLFFSLLLLYSFPLYSSVFFSHFGCCWLLAIAGCVQDCEVNIVRWLNKHTCAVWHVNRALSV